MDSIYIELNVTLCYNIKIETHKNKILYERKKTHGTYNTYCNCLSYCHSNRQN